MLAGAALAAGPPVAERPSTEIEQAFARMYNTDFRNANTCLEHYIAAQPSDPLGYAVQASAYLFSEFDRLGILESEFFADDKRLVEKKKLKPDPDVRNKFFQAVHDAQSRATTVLAGNPNDQNALFAMAITQGVTMDYTALIDKHQLSSLSSARRANDFAQRLLKVNPQFYDAYLTTGLSEYLMGSLPFYVKWFVHFDGVDGNKDEGFHNLQIVAASGHYLRPFAKILLAIMYLREKQPQETRKLLAALAVEYPENQLLHKELERVTSHFESPAAR